MDSFDILVVILSVTLSIFLILATIFVIYLIKIARTVKEITEKARSAADSFESAANIFKKTAGPAVFSRIVANIVESWKSSKDSKKKE